MTDRRYRVVALLLIATLVANPALATTYLSAEPIPAADAVSAGDINVLGHVLGFVLSQGSTALFTPDNAKANQFPLDYAVVTLAAPLSGERAKEFFEFVGTVAPALFSGLFAGFTQIDFAGSTTNNSMLFLKPAVTKQQFITGLSTAASLDPEASYVTLNNHGQPTTAKAGVAFPEPDWIGFPNGDQYLSQIGNVSPALSNALAALRQRHLAQVSDLIRAIDRNNVAGYLDRQFRCR
jgi:hypothetical protein